MAVFGDLNEAQILGNITQDLEVRYTTGGNAVVNFSVATNRSFRKQDEEEWQEEVTFHNVVVWGKDAEFLAQRAGKGTRLYVKGRLQIRSWEDAEGKKNYRTEIIAEKIILLDRYNKSSGESAKSDSSSKKDKEDTKESIKSGKDEIDPDDLPF